MTQPGTSRNDLSWCLANLGAPLGDETEAGWLSAAALLATSGAPLHREQDPHQHLCTYVVLLDASSRNVLLVDHRKAGLRVPAGGHVEPGEDPPDTAVRELFEELGLAVGDAAWWHPLFGERPLMVSWTDIDPAVRHVDITLWFVLQGRFDAVTLNMTELTGYSVVPLVDAEHLPTADVDPHWPRFVRKLRRALADPAGGFFERDEPVSGVVAAFEGGPQGITAPPAARSGSTRVAELDRLERVLGVNVPDLHARIRGYLGEHEHEPTCPAEQHADCACDTARMVAALRAVVRRHELAPLGWHVRDVDRDAVEGLSACPRCNDGTRSNPVCHEIREVAIALGLA